MALNWRILTPQTMTKKTRKKDFVPSRFPLP
jgi:hypothetical protein